MKTFKMLLVLVLLVCFVGITNARTPVIGDEVRIVVGNLPYNYHYQAIITDIDDSMISINTYYSWLQRPYPSDLRISENFERYNVTVSKTAIIKLIWLDEFNHTSTN